MNRRSKTMPNFEQRGASVGVNVFRHLSPHTQQTTSLLRTLTLDDPKVSF